MWNKKTHNFGNITPGSTYNAEFIYGGSDTIERITVSCGCTVVNNKNNKVKVSFTPSKKNKDVFMDPRFHGDDNESGNDNIRR